MYSNKQEYCILFMFTASCFGPFLWL